MRVKLTVSHADREGETRTYVLEQDPITIGRGGTCDLPLDDPDRVVSKEHAQIRREGEALRVFDLGSKNQTFVNGHRVGTTGIAVADGDRIHLGPFVIDVAVDRDRLVADDLDRTVFGVAFANPFQDTAQGLALALGQLRRAFAETDYGHRADALADALRGALGPGPDADLLSGLVAGTPAASPPAPPSARASPSAPAWPGAVPPVPVPDPSRPTDPFGAPFALGPPPAAAPIDPFAPPAMPTPPRSGANPFAPPPVAPPAMPAGGAMPGAMPVPPLSTSPVAAHPAAVVPMAPAPAMVTDDVMRALAAAAARLVSLPGQFRHEFLGHTVIESPETAFLFDADVDALVAHLAHPEASERAGRQQRLREAAEAVLHHHQGLLEGYRAAVRDGAAMLVDALDPDCLDDGGGGLMPGARERALLERLRQRVAEMRGDGFAAAERRVYRPAFIQAYLDSVARAEAAPPPAPPSDP